MITLGIMTQFGTSTFGSSLPQNHMYGYLLLFFIQAEYSRLYQGLDFIFEDETILGRLAYDSVIVAVFGVFLYTPLPLNSGLLSSDSSILLLLTSMLKILSAWSFLNEYFFYVHCDSGSLPGWQILLGFHNYSTTFFPLNLEEGGRIVVVPSRCLPLSLAYNVEINFSIISFWNAPMLVPIFTRRLCLQVCSSIERGMSLEHLIERFLNLSMKLFTDSSFLRFSSIKVSMNTSVSFS